MKKKKKFYDLAIIVAVIELAIFYVGMILMSVVVTPVTVLSDGMQNPGKEFVNTAATHFAFFIQILMCLLYMRITKKERLKVFAMSTAGKRIAKTFYGLFAGIIVNGAISAIVYLTGSVQPVFQGFTWMLIAILPFSFIQCSMEEVLLRGYVSSYLEENYKWYVIAPIGGVLFILHHIGNLAHYGFSPIFCLNVLLIGIAFYLMVKWSGNFWICCGFHTGWNYTQQFLFGLPNSGQTSAFGLFRGENAVKSFVFDPVYGNEGSLLTTVVLIVSIGVLFLLIKIKAAKGTNPLTEKMIER